ncbi:iroquois-class homeodomain protein IRX-6 isoform X6 [Rhinopithecus roxellana]|uniref:iroquois-class homeodomain protein IRX-6 isoform X6 n=1 Tax=Rhinopithecus roxellana TaxID=61622 RepID=UPI0012374B8E|nr:iroquois-class homeodomain protein IRX-6 isoform X6 [Rhinopithecus roxellana]
MRTFHPGVHPGKSCDLKHGPSDHALSEFLVSASSSTTCCESTPRSVSDVASGSTPAPALCCAPYDSRLLGSARPELGTTLGIYGAPYTAAAAAQSYPGYLPYSPEPPALYGALNPQYEFKEAAGSFTPSLAQPGAYYPYERTLGQYQYERYGAVELSGTGRRKNATRETTSTLKAWLNEHRKNPYPTKEVTASQEARGLRLSDLEDLEEEEEEEAEDEEVVSTAADRLTEFRKGAQSLPGPCAAAREGRLERRECGLAAPRFSFSEPSGSEEADFLAAETGGPRLTMNYPCVEKPRIWSLAHTAAASAVEGAPPARPRPRSSECHMIPGQPPASARRLSVPRDSPCDESSCIAKAFGNPRFALQGLPLNCAPCPRRSEPVVQCQYPSGAEAG